MLTPSTESFVDDKHVMNERLRNELQELQDICNRQNRAIDLYLGSYFLIEADQRVINEEVRLQKDN